MSAHTRTCSLSITGARNRAAAAALVAVGVVGVVGVGEGAAAGSGVDAAGAGGHAIRVIRAIWLALLPPASPSMAGSAWIDTSAVMRGRESLA